MPEFVKKEKVTIQSIILDQIMAISKKSLIEFRGGYNIIKDHGNWNETIQVPDSRKEFIQGIEFLSYLIIPRYDKIMTEKSKEITKKVDDILKKYEDTKEEMDYETFITQKLRLIIKLFQAIQVFFHRTKFFKREEVYG